MRSPRASALRKESRPVKGEVFRLQPVRLDPSTAAVQYVDAGKSGFGKVL